MVELLKLWKEIEADLESGSFATRHVQHSEDRSRLIATPEKKLVKNKARKKHFRKLHAEICKGKKWFRSFAACKADIILVQSSGHPKNKPVYPYHCKVCGGWHKTSNP